MGKWTRADGVAYNFLGTFTSRYSNYDGYWLFGFLVPNFAVVRVNLLQANVEQDDAICSFMKQRAVVRFADQCQKGRLALSTISTAILKLHQLPERVPGEINGHPCSGFHVRFDVEVFGVDGRRGHSSCELFVAPHNPAVERQSTQRDRP